MTMSAARVLAEVQQAQTRLARFVPAPTPFEAVSLPGLSLPVFLKREDISPVRSYKWRGAFNRMMHLAENGDSRPVVTASAGNHAQGVAWAARMLGMQANIYMPVSTPMVKQQAVRMHGGANVHVELVGDTYNQAADAAHAQAERTGEIYVPAFDNLHTIAGQATMGTEIVASNAGPFDVAFLQIGGGGMAAGVSSVLRAAYPGIKLIGVEGEGQACMKASLDASRLITLNQVDGFCDGTAVTRPGDLCFDVCRETLDQVITVSNGDVHSAMKMMWDTTRSIPEPSGAMGLAGLMQWSGLHPEARDARMMTVISGANMDFNKLRDLFSGAAENTKGRRHMRLTIGEQNGSLVELAETCFSDVNIIGFQYGKVDHVNAWPVIVFDADDAKMASITSCLKATGVAYEDITGAPDANVIHYDARLFSNPLVLQVSFPERKGALREFMRAVRPHANMCYFNYQYTGDVQSTALMVFEFKSGDQHAPFLDAIRHSPVTFRPVDDRVRARMLYNAPGPV